MDRGVSKLFLPQVTLCAVDTRAPMLAAQSLMRSMRGVAFARAVLFSHGLDRAALPAAIEYADIGPIDSGVEYSHFMLRRLGEHVATPFVLVTQWDGFVVDPAQWSDDFLAFDYVGAPWHDQPQALCVGNGGFSLRSQRLLQASRDPRVNPVHPEDQALCRDHRALLEREHGVRFAPPALARRFSFENTRRGASTFGFHGPYHLPRFVDEATLAGWLDALPETFYRSRDARRMARALLRFGMAQTAVRLLERRRAAGRREPSTRLLEIVASVLTARAGASAHTPRAGPTAGPRTAE
jgi:hypothetical protein